MKINRFLYFVGVLIFCWATGAHAEGNCGKPDPDFRYVGLFPDNQKAQLLEISIDLTNQKPAQTISLVSTETGDKPTSCTISLKPGWGLHEGGCSLTPLWTGTAGASYWFVFPVKAVKDQDVEFFTDPLSRHTARIAQEHSSKKWIRTVSLDNSPFRGMVVSGHEGTVVLDLHNTASPDSAVAVSCRVGASEHSDYLMLTGSTNGDWLAAQCDVGKCSSELSPLQCQKIDEETGKSEAQNSLGPPCPMGWIRWRSSSGQVLLRINHAVDMFCCGD